MKKMKTLLLMSDEDSEIEHGDEEAPATQRMTRLWWEDDEDAISSSEIVALFV